MAVQFTDEQTDVAVNGERLVALTRHVLASQRVPGDMEVGILAVDVDTMASLNETHMGKQGPTDVLAFPIDEPGTTPPDVPAVLGDVVLCPAVAHEQAGQMSRTGPDEVDYLLVHGLLHLLGMDHAEPVEQAAMFGLTDRLLGAFVEAFNATEEGAGPAVDDAAPQSGTGDGP